VPLRQPTLLSGQDARRFREHIRTVRDYPKPGFPFADIAPALALPDMLQRVTRAFAAALADHVFDFVVGIEARGFIFAAPLAAKLGKGLVLARKCGGVPGSKMSIKYESEYDPKGALELSTTVLSPGSKCVIADDFLATGGTAAAAACLVESVGSNVSAFVFLIEDESLRGRDRLSGKPVITALTY
jgi:adenine phosphoribosyltransferase